MIIRWKEYVAVVKVNYVGCDDPGKFIAQERAEQECLVRDGCCQFSWWQYFQDIEEGKAPMPEPWEWMSYASFEDYRAAMLAKEEESEAFDRTVKGFVSGRFPDVLAEMPGVEFGDPVDDAVVDGVVAEVRSRFGIRLADDYVEYLRRYGLMSVCGVRQTGIDPSGEHSIVECIAQVRRELGIREEYYPLASMDEAWSMAMMYFQDADGFVYMLDQKRVFRPVGRNLLEYVVAMWCGPKEDLM